METDQLLSKTIVVYKLILQMRNFTSMVFIGSILAITTNFSIIQPSQAAYPPACGVKPTTTEEGTARTNLRKNLGSNSYPV
jgi:hypothetical protein